MGNVIKLRPGAIEWIMEEYGIKTRAQLANELNISAAMLSQISSGRRGTSTVFLVGAYKAYGIGLDHQIYQITQHRDNDVD